MCIRDRAKEGTAKLNKATDGLGTLVSGVDEINTNMQALAKGLQDGSNELNASPVSYTHLDVYKRQARL